MKMYKHTNYDHIYYMTAIYGVVIHTTCEMRARIACISAKCSHHLTLHDSEILISSMKYAETENYILV